MLLAVGLVVGVMIHSVHVSTDRDKRDRARAEQAAPAPDPRPLAVEDAPARGLARPEPEPEAPKPAETGEKPPLVNVIHTPKPTPEYTARQRELDALRKKRVRALEKALAAPLRVNVPASVRRPHSQAASAVRAGSAGQSVRDRHPVPDMNGMAMPATQGPDERVEKEEFLSSRARPDSQWTLAHRRAPGNAMELKTGTVIPALMLTGINSDLPGSLIAQVSGHVFDTASGEHLLIPQGARLYGLYDSRVAMGQTRLLVAWNRILFPDGSSISLGAMPGADMAGLAGFRGEVDNHYLKIFGSAAIMSLISGGMAYGMDNLDHSSDEDDSPSLQDEMGSALASQLGQASLGLLQRNMQIKPELNIEPGYRFNMVVTKDIVFDQPYRPWR
ncbi:TrbI/VirB10 family protein [Pseudodesulfovibrio tunisiensis]|uniref:TrbI/VirB10 family protein n=1 Tax=Pseudodesulfovibrio tunisiensis TaxID=463192 RepID=UPI001FB2AC54|nr:TrbI/VirB10 family protein [Pseudodesulfovibrio tunisiensis]